MTLWMVRAGSYGEHEPKFFDTNRVYLTWEGDGWQGTSFAKAKDYEDIRKVVNDLYPEGSVGQKSNTTGQLATFVLKIKPGDWVITPRKTKPAIAIGEVTGSYEYNPKEVDPYRHSRAVKWLSQDIPRSNFDQDILYSLGAFMTICAIHRNDAEKRIRAMSKASWKPLKGFPAVQIKEGADASDAGEESPIDLERLSRDQIARQITRKLKGHGLARLVDAILRAQGYTTHLSKEGPDKGIDILAAPGALGFGEPRICVQVKSGDSPVDLPTLNQLIGAMQNVRAQQGLLVSWGGFKSTVDRELPTQFFHVRMWDQDTIIDELLANYDKIDAELRAEIPLKRIWVAVPEEGE
jgi:restriction system protein